MTDLISRQQAIDGADEIIKRDTSGNNAVVEAMKAWKLYIGNLPSAYPKEVTPYRNYKYLSDYWCECGWHLGKKGEVKYCSNCGRKVHWDE